MTWFFPDAKSDSRMTTTKWHKKPDETQDEYQQKLKEVQRGKVAHETNMSSNQRPTSRPPTREQLPQGPAPKSSQEHPIQNTQRESSGTVGTPCDTVTRRPDAGTYSAQNVEAMRDVDMPQAAQPTQKVPEQTQSPPAETRERPPTIPELQWGIMQILHKNPNKFYAEQYESRVQGIIESAFSKFDSRQGVRKLIWIFITALEDCTTWDELDNDHKRCFIDHHMTKLLNSNLLSRDWTHHCGQLRDELQRIG